MHSVVCIVYFEMLHLLALILNISTMKHWQGSNKKKNKRCSILYLQILLFFFELKTKDDNGGDTRCVEYTLVFIILESYLTEVGQIAKYGQWLRNYWQNNFALSFNKDPALREIIIGYITKETYAPGILIPLRSHIRRKERDSKAKQGYRSRADWQKIAHFSLMTGKLLFPLWFLSLLASITCFYCSLCYSDLYLLKSPLFKICCTVLRNNA